MTKKHRSSSAQDPFNSVDGIVTSGSVSDLHPGKGASGLRTSNIRERGNQLLARTRLDNFKLSDGFHPAKQPQLQSTDARPLGRSPHRRKDGKIELNLQPAPDKPTKKTIWKKLRLKPFTWKKGLISSAVVILLIFGFLFGRGIWGLHNVLNGGGNAAALDPNADPNLLNGEGDGRVNILLLGVGGSGHDGPDLTDTILLASIDPINNKAVLLSIPRDLWVNIPGHGQQKINAAYAYGKEESTAKSITTRKRAGIALLDQTLQPILGIPIQYHAVVNFSAFKQAVDAVGGVKIDVTEQLYDPSIAWENNNNPIIAAKGIQVMLGQQALLYARSRETSSDFARGQRQRQLLEGLKDKAFSLGTLSNPLKVSNLLSSLGSNVYTDLSLDNLLRLRDISSQITSSNITSLDMVTPPNALLTTGGVNGLSVVEPRAGLFNYDAIRLFVRKSLIDGHITKENAKILILNGTSVAGLATTKKTELKSYGYNIIGVKDAPTHNYSQTILVDLRNGLNKYTQHYLEQRFKTTAVTSLPDTKIDPGLADFVIILGQNENTGT